MWLSALKLAVSAGSKIYANKQKTKMAMSDAQLMHAKYFCLFHFDQMPKLPSPSKTPAKNIILFFSDRFS